MNRAGLNIGMLFLMMVPVLYANQDIPSDSVYSINLADSRSSQQNKNTAVLPDLIWIFCDSTIGTILAFYLRRIIIRK